MFIPKTITFPEVDTTDRDGLTITTIASLYNTDLSRVQYTNDNGLTWFSVATTEDVSSVTLQEAFDDGDGTITSTIDKPFVVNGYIRLNGPVDLNFNSLVNVLDINSIPVSTLVATTGATMTGDLILNADPSSSLQAATKNYVDETTAGFHPLSANAATTSLIVGTYNNGASGVGATIATTATGDFYIDGILVISGGPYLIKDQTNSYENGYYNCTQQGGIGIQTIFTRALNYNTPAEIQPGTFFVITYGSTNAGASFIQTATVTTIGTDPIIFDNWGGQNITLVGAVTGTGFSPVTTTLATVTVDIGIFGDDGHVPQITITPEGLVTAVTDVAITPEAIGAPANDGTGATGTWDINILGLAGGLSGPYVFSIIGTDNQVIASNPNGNVTLSLPQSIGTGSSPTFNGLNIVSANVASLSATSLVGTDAFRNLVSTALVGDVTTSGLTTTIANNAVTFAKMQNINGHSLIGNSSPSSADPTNIAVGNAFQFLGPILTTVAFTGDVTTPGNSFATTIAPNAVTFPKMQLISPFTIMGNLTGIPNNPSAINPGATLGFAGGLFITNPITGDVTSPSNSFVTTIANNAVTFAKMQDIAGFSLMGNSSGSTGNPGVVVPGSTLVFASNFLQTVAMTGDVTSSQNSFSTTLATVNSTPGIVGNATHIAQVTANAKGLVTNLVSVPVNGLFLDEITFTSNGTYFPNPAANTIVVYIVGAGGGGGGAGGGATSGLSGGSTLLGSHTALGGGGGQGANSTFGGDGALSGGVGGNGGGAGGSTGGVAAFGGQGGGSALFAGGARGISGGVGLNGFSGIPHTGGGGGGGACNSAGGGGGGGGSGQTLNLTLSVTGSMAVTLGVGGNGGAAGIGGGTGGQGGSGVVVIQEFT